MSKLNEILSRLSGVVPAPDDNYKANCPCPSHSKTNNGKLYLKDGGNVVLIDCKSGCSAMEVLYEIELELKDLYPDSDPIEREKWRESRVIRAVAHKRDKTALELWTMATIIAESLKTRIFDQDKHPTNRTELWSKEAQAVRLLPALFREYYK